MTVVVPLVTGAVQESETPLVTAAALSPVGVPGAEGTNNEPIEQSSSLLRAPAWSVTGHKVTGELSTTRPVGSGTAPTSGAEALGSTVSVPPPLAARVPRSPGRAASVTSVAAPRHWVPLPAAL